MSSTDDYELQATKRPGRHPGGWTPHAQPPVLSRGSAHVWLLDLDASDIPTMLASSLSDNDRRRTEAMRSRLLRQRSMAAHSVLRVVLGSYTGIEPARLRFVRNDCGKPRLELDDQGIEFNLSKAGRWALIAAARAATVGVDIERTRPLSNFATLAASALSRDELDQLAELPIGDQQPAFYRAWTRKEAYLKAIGVGIADGLQEVTVSLDKNAALLSAGKDRPVGQWRLLDVPVGEGYAAALAIDGADATIRLLAYSPN